MKKKFKKGQELTFDVYGTKIMGKFISFEANDLVKIEVTYDGIGVCAVGEISTINKKYLVEEESLHGHITPIKPQPFVVVGEVPKADIVNALIVAAFRLDDEAFGWLMEKLNQRKVSYKILKGLLKEILAREQEIIYDVKRFNGVSTNHIKSVFEKYGIVNETKF